MGIREVHRLLKLAILTVAAAVAVYVSIGIVFPRHIDRTAPDLDGTDHVVITCDRILPALLTASEGPRIGVCRLANQLIPFTYDGDNPVAVIRGSLNHSEQDDLLSAAVASYRQSGDQLRRDVFVDTTTDSTAILILTGALVLIAIAAWVLWSRARQRGRRLQ